VARARSSRGGRSGRGKKHAANHLLGDSTSPIGRVDVLGRPMHAFRTRSGARCATARSASYISSITC